MGSSDAASVFIFRPGPNFKPTAALIPQHNRDPFTRRAAHRLNQRSPLALDDPPPHPVAIPNDPVFKRNINCRTAGTRRQSHDPLRRFKDRFLGIILAHHNDRCMRISMVASPTAHKVFRISEPTNELLFSQVLDLCKNAFHVGGAKARNLQLTLLAHREHAPALHRHYGEHRMIEEIKPVLVSWFLTGCSCAIEPFLYPT